MNDNVTHLQTTVKTDIEKAREYRERMLVPLQEICKVVSEAKRDGIIISYQTAADGLGNQFIANLSTLKELKD